MFIPTKGWLHGYMITRHFGVPLARYMEGSRVVRSRYGFTKFHALERVVKR